MAHKKKAVIIFSGGLDSTTCLAVSLAQQFECYALTFDYGQRNAAELAAARKVTQIYGVPHKIFSLNIGQFGGSALVDKTIPVPTSEEFSLKEGIPPTYVPARNTIFLSIALGYAETLGARHIVSGVNAVDYSQYPDCRPDYIQAFQQLANLATKAGAEGDTFTIHTPLLHLTKAQIIELGHRHNVDYSMTVTCYQPDHEGKACGKCDSCHFRRKGFEEAAIPDPTRYQNV